MSEQIFSADELPVASFYVTAMDTYLGGWRHPQGKENMVILPCDSAHEADIVEENANARSDMAQVEVVRYIEFDDEEMHYSLMDKECAARWYRKGGFTEE